MPGNRMSALGLLLLSLGILVNSNVTAGGIQVGQVGGYYASHVEIPYAALHAFEEPDIQLGTVISNFGRVHGDDLETTGLLHRVAGQDDTTPEGCLPHISYAIELADTLGQVKHVGGREIRGNEMEVYVNPATLSWTLVLVLPSGLACKVGEGNEFLMEPLPAKV